MSAPLPVSNPPYSVERTAGVLLAVDLGLRTGLARFERSGRLQHYESRNFGTMSRLKRAVPTLLRECADLQYVILEGGGPIAEVWRREIERRQIAHQIVAAETWRGALLYPRRQRSGENAKRNAGDIARRVIAWSAALSTKSLRDDAAEAILLGLWGVWRVGWLPEIPSKVLHGRGRDALESLACPEAFWTKEAKDRVKSKR